ncbi:MAG: Rne/Rng family ribonuclease [Lentisphaeria bacterium]|nr:Rne/Rng family ribonuclease [Lentisphaeria bacterium]
MKQILINSEELQDRVAVVENGELEEFLIERKDRDRLSGSIFKARIRNLEPSLQAAFVDIGSEKNAFLHYWDMLPATQDMLEEDEPSPEPLPEPESAPVEPVAAARRGGILGRLRRLLAPGPRLAAAAEESPAARPRSRRRRSRRPAFTVEDIPELFKESKDILVQVSKGPIGNKGARVTTNLSIPGRYLVLLPNSSHVGVSKRVEGREERDRLRQILRRLDIPTGMGVICRTVGAGRDEKQFRQDLAMLLDTWRKLDEKSRSTPAPCCVYREPGLTERCLRDFLTEDVDEVVTDAKETCDLANDLVRRLSRQERVKVRLYRNPTPLFDRYKLAQQLESVFRRQVPLPGGGYICVDETEALIAIDVNSGKNRSGKDHPETILTTNLEAVHEAARQLRLRNLGGLIVIDFIDMRSKKDQLTVYRALKEELARDRARTRTCPISSLGLVEMTRQRETESLRSTVYSPCPYCEGKGLVKSATTMSVEIQRRLQEIMKRYRRTLQLRVTVHPSILDRLRNEDAALLADLEQGFGRELTFRGDPSLHMEEFRILNAETGGEL